MKTQTGKLHKIIVRNRTTQIKIEPNFTMRGTLLPIKRMDVVKMVEDKFEYSIKQIPILAEEEVYAGKKRFSFLLKNINVNQHETRRELLTPDELIRLPDVVAIIFKTGHSLIYGRKIRYYADPLFRVRAQMTIPQSDRLMIGTVWHSIKSDDALITHFEKKI